MWHCEREYFTKRSLIEHKWIRHNELLQKCLILRFLFWIGYGSQTSGLLASHQLKQHQIGTRLPCPNESCTKTFLGKHIRDKHQKICQTGKLYHCEKCSKVFKTKAYTKHWDKQYGVECSRYQGDLCGKPLTSAEALKKHAQWHIRKQK